MKWATLAILLLLLVLSSILTVQWEQLETMREIVAQGAHTMTDPGPMELKATWVHAYDGSTPIYHVITCTRNAPAETVTDWQTRFQATIKADLVDPATKPYGT